MKHQSVVWNLALCGLLAVAVIATAQEPTAPAPVAPKADQEPAAPAPAAPVAAPEPTAPAPVAPKADQDPAAPAPAAPVAAQEPTAPAPVAPKADQDPAAPAPAASVADAFIETNYKDADINSALTSLARRAGLSLIIGDGVSGKVSVHLENVTAREAIRLITESKGFVMEENKNIVKIRTKEAAETQPLDVRVYTLKYAKSDEVKKLLDDMKSPRGKIQADLRSNMLILSDTSLQLAKLIPVIEKLDTQTPQVIIEAKFIETTRNPKKDLGVNWSGVALNHAMTVGGAPKGTTVPPSGGAANITTASPGNFQMFHGAGIPTWGSMAVLDLGTASLVFSFLNQDADSELLACPRIVTADNGKAKINITQQYPLPSFTFDQQTAGLQINGFNYKDIGIILNVTPRINSDSFITLDIAPEVSSSSQSVPFSSANGSSFNIPIIDTRQAATTVLIKSGNTLAMGGLIREDVADNYTKVPIMGDIPGLGVLFRSKSLSRVKRNLLIFLTPTVVRPDQVNPTGLEKYVNGVPKEEIYTNDTWMPKDNAKPRQFIKLPPPKPVRTTPLISDSPDTVDAPAPSKAPAANFSAK